MKNILYFLIIIMMGIIFTVIGLTRLYYISGVKKRGLIITGIITLVIWTLVAIYLTLKN